MPGLDVAAYVRIVEFHTSPAIQKQGIGDGRGTVNVVKPPDPEEKARRQFSNSVSVKVVAPDAAVLFLLPGAQLRAGCADPRRR